MATPFPTDLVAAPTGGRIAWVSSNSGVHNILVTDASATTTGPLTMGSPDHKWRAVTTYKGDDGLWITDLNWTSDGKTIVYVRGDGANRQGENPNPAQLQDGTEQAVFAVSVDGGAPKKLGVGNGPVPSPRGQRVAWVSRGQIWSADLGSTEAAARLVNARGSASGLAWSPDGTMLAFTSGRGTHSYIGVFTLGVAGVALPRSVARSRRQCRVVTGRHEDRVDSPGRRAARRACSRHGARWTSRGRCASPT